jgi:2-polyprenyl-3-methyl-5-hydroxy-6-metoxy-1,4-benzoquinol methylase
MCASGRNRLFDRRRFHGHEVINRLCLNCGLVYQSPRMTEVETASFYAEEYRLLNEGSIDPTGHNIATQYARAESLLAFTQPLVEKITCHLDIGCSLGILLQRFTNTFHCQPIGIEPGEAHRDYACNNGLTVYASLEALEKEREGHFDLISMSHVLEHLPDPVDYLVHLREFLLTPDGWLLLEVPNLYAHDSFEVAHLYAFSPHTLQEVLCRGGFKIAKFEKHGRPNSAVLPLYLTVLCRPSLKPYLVRVRPERWVATKRRMVMLKRHILGRLMPARAWLNI